MKKTTNNSERKVDTIYIISKGRPECKTARTLIELGYPGEWFIVCGTNDETLPQYKENYGDHVLVFDWAEQIKHTDVMDNFGFEKMPSGAAPVRNAVFDFSRARGEVRHWQLDDDFTGFYLTNTSLTKNVHIKSGKIFYYWMHRIAQFADDAKLANVGFKLKLESFPGDAKSFSRRIYAAHNMSNEGLTPEWRGRFNDDTINAIDTQRLGQQKEMQLKFLSINTPVTQQDPGGLTDMYKTLGTVRKTAYLILLAPNAAKLVIHFGRYHHSVVWKNLIPELIAEKWRKR